MGSLVVLGTLVSCVACAMSMWLIRKRTKEFALSHMLPFPLVSQHFPNCFQCILIFDPASPAVQNASTTTVLRKVMDPVHLLFAEQRSFFYINMRLTHRAPCFYIFRRSLDFQHPGKSLSKPYLLNKSKYTMLGCISERVHDFCLKHDLEHFYSSYLPPELFGKDPKTSLVEIKIGVDEATEEFVREFVELFGSMNHEPENKYQRVTKEFGLIRSREKAYENLSFFQKLDRQSRMKKNK